MWDAAIMRWVAIPAIFAVVGPPAGAIVLAIIPVVTALVHPGVVLAAPVILPLMIAFSYPFGGFQALLVGLVAAGAVRPGGRVRAWPPLLAALAFGLGLGFLAASWPADGGGSLVNFLTFAAIHGAGALAGLGVCRWVERSGGRRA